MPDVHRRRRRLLLLARQQKGTRGGSGSNSEIDGPMTEIGYRLHCARSWIKGMGLADNPRRGVWALTPADRDVTEAQMAPLRAKHITSDKARSRVHKRPKSSAQQRATPSTQGEGGLSSSARDRATSLLSTVSQPPPARRYLFQCLTSSTFVKRTSNRNCSKSSSRAHWLGTNLCRRLRALTYRPDAPP